MAEPGTKVRVNKVRDLNCLFEIVHRLTLNITERIPEVIDYQPDAAAQSRSGEA